MWYPGHPLRTACFPLKTSLMAWTTAVALGPDVSVLTTMFLLLLSRDQRLQPVPLPQDGCTDRLCSAHLVHIPWWVHLSDWAWAGCSLLSFLAYKGAEHRAQHIQADERRARSARHSPHFSQMQLALTIPGSYCWNQGPDAYVRVSHEILFQKLISETQMAILLVQGTSQSSAGRCWMTHLSSCSSSVWVQHQLRVSSVLHSDSKSGSA
jgi:hypothetical protein